MPLGALDPSMAFLTLVLTLLSISDRADVSPGVEGDRPRGQEAFFLSGQAVHPPCRHDEVAPAGPRQQDASLPDDSDTDEDSDPETALHDDSRIIETVDPYLCATRRGGRSTARSLAVITPLRR